VLNRHQSIAVFTPAFGSERYDLVIDRDGDLQRVQVKTAYDHHDRDGTIVVEFDRTVYDSDGTPQKTYYTSDELDAYVVYYEPTDVTLFVPFDETPETQMNFSLRDPGDYGEYNRKAIHFVGDYTLDERL